MSKVNGHTAEEVIQAIEDAHGILTVAASKLGISRVTIWRYCKRYPTIQLAYETERDKWIDMAEGQLMKAVQKGSIPAIMFFLKTVGRNRGYVERQEVEHGEITLRIVRDGTNSKSS